MMAEYLLLALRHILTLLQRARPGKKIAKSILSRADKVAQNWSSSHVISRPNFQQRRRTFDKSV